jgi:DNA polymerase III epsilon subunit family exonuclease
MAQLRRGIAPSAAWKAPMSEDAAAEVESLLLKLKAAKSPTTRLRTKLAHRLPANPKFEPLQFDPGVFTPGPTFNQRPRVTPDIALKQKVQAGGRILVLDTETTGLATSDRIVSLAAFRMVGLEILPEALYLVFDPEIDSHPKAAEVHGWDDWTTRHQDLFADTAAHIRDWLNWADLIVAHNAAFDLGFLAREFRAAGVAGLRKRSACTVDLARRVWTGQRASLDACLSRIGLARAGERHGAFEDAFLALNLFRYLMGAAHAYEFGPGWPQPANLRPVPDRPADPLPPRTPRVVPGDAGAS